MTFQQFFITWTTQVVRRGWASEAWGFHTLRVALAAPREDTPEEKWWWACEAGFYRNPERPTITGEHHDAMKALMYELSGYRPKY